MTMQNKQSLSLYSISVEYQRLLPMLFDYETGEIDMEIQAQIDALGESSEKKCIAFASWIKKLELDRLQIETMKEEIIKREFAFNKEITKCHDYLKRNMEQCGMTEVKSPFFTLKIKKNPYSTDIIDETKIPERFFNTREIIKIERKPDKNAIKEEVLKTGVQVPGVIVQQKTKLEILTDKI